MTLQVSCSGLDVPGAVRDRSADDGTVRFVAARSVADRSAGTDRVPSTFA